LVYAGPRKLRFDDNTPLIFSSSCDRNQRDGRIVKRTQHFGSPGGIAVSAALAALLLLPDPDHLLRERYFFMSRTAAADEAKKAARTTPPARNPDAAVEEEYPLALRQGTAAALELFIARHPDSPLAEKARAGLRRPSR
jgi:hypothetical protein